MNKPKVNSLMQEGAIGALAQELLPALLTQMVVVRYEHGELFPRTRERHIERSQQERVQEAFRVAELFLHERTRRLRASEAKLYAARATRQKRKARKGRS